MSLMIIEPKSEKTIKYLFRNLIFNLQYLYEDKGGDKLWETRKKALPLLVDISWDQQFQHVESSRL